MDIRLNRPIQITFITVGVLIFGIAMLVYWGLFIAQGIPTEGIPVLAELINACLALISAYGLVRLRRWSVPTSLVLAGMWSYGALGGINLVLEDGLDFTSPFGAMTDAILFPLVLAFAVYMAVCIWRNRALFQ